MVMVNGHGHGHGVLRSSTQEREKLIAVLTAGEAGELWVGALRSFDEPCVLLWETPVVQKGWKLSISSGITNSF